MKKITFLLLILFLCNQGFAQENNKKPFEIFIDVKCTVKKEHTEAKKNSKKQYGFIGSVERPDGSKIMASFIVEKIYNDIEINRFDEYIDTGDIITIRLYEEDVTKWYSSTPNNYKQIQRLNRGKRVFLTYWSILDVNGAEIIIPSDENTREYLSNNVRNRY